MGAGESVTRSRIEASWSRSSASSVLSTALPRSMSTTTPAGPSARSMASMIATASVPNVVSSSPAATSILSGRPCSISAARATAERASVRLWETTTSPTPCSALGVGESPERLSVMSTALRSLVARVSQVAQKGAWVAASSSSATVVAPGSWWPTLRSPR